MNRNDYYTLRDFVLGQSELYSSRAFVQYYDKNKELVSVTYKELKRDIEALGTFLINAGYEKKQIAIVSENSYDWIRAFFAISFSGNICVPISKDLGKDIVAENLKNADCCAVFYSRKSSKLIEDIAGSEKDSKLTIFSMSEIEGYISEGEQLIADGDISFMEKKVLPDDVAAIFFTSGTTGSQKGVMLTQQNFVFNIYATAERIYDAVERHYLLLILPLTHVLSFHSLCDIFINGRTLFVCQGIKHFFTDLVSVKPDITCMVPLFLETIYKEVMKELSSKHLLVFYRVICIVSGMLLSIGVDLRGVFFKKIRNKMGGNLKTVISGGAPISQKVLDEFHNWGVEVAYGYGITECAPSISFCEYKDSKANSVGKILNGIEVIIEKPDEKGIGEVCVKGPVVMKGYYNNLEETEIALKNGFFHTGDLGYIDKQGYLFIAGRKKNLIILSNGENTSPEMLENKLIKHSIVKEVLVYQKENKIVAEIFPDESYITQNNVRDVKMICEKCVALSNKELPAYARISDVVIRTSEFEKSASKKIKRNYVGAKK